MTLRPVRRSTGASPPGRPRCAANTSFIISIAMSHRTPSHWSAMPSEGLDHPGAELRGERIQLDDVRPRWEVGIATVGQDAAAEVDERRWVPLHVLGVAEDEPVGVSADPRMVGRDVVGHEVQHQPHASRLQLSPGRGQARPARRDGHPRRSRARSTASRPRRPRRSPEVRP